MKILYIIFLVLLMDSSNILAQQITDVVATYEKNKVIVAYNIVSFSTKTMYNIELKFKDDKYNTISPKYLSGDIGYVEGGNNKKIVWDIQKEHNVFIGKIKPVVTIIDKYEMLGGPSNALLSLLVPGLGNKFVSEDYSSPVNYKTFLTYGFIGYGIFQKIRCDDLYKKYQNATEQYEIDEHYEKANNANHHYKIAFALGAAIWLYDVIWVLIKGIENDTDNEKIINSSKFNYSFGYDGQILGCHFKLTF